MRHSEFERRRRAIERQLEEDLELVRAGYRAKLRALEMLWLASPGEDGTGAETVPSVGGDHRTAEEVSQESSETLNASETPGPSETLNETLASPVPQRGDVLRDIEAVLDRLPAVFDKQDIVRALGYSPPRATLYRVISQLKENKKIATQEYSDGRNRTKYRKETAS